MMWINALSNIGLGVTEALARRESQKMAQKRMRQSSSALGDATQEPEKPCSPCEAARKRAAERAARMVKR